MFIFHVMMQWWMFIRTFNTRWVITVVTALVIVVNLLSPAWRRGEVIRGEVELHYGVLPAIFYEGSLCSVARAGDDETSRDNVSVGTAISHLPFFALAHVAAKATGAPADGYSAPYQLMVLFSSLVYFVIGLIFLSKLLRLHFPGQVCAITLLVVSLGTNVFYYLTAAGGTPHALGMMLTVLFLYQVIAWHQLRDNRSAVQLGLLLGALWLVQPVNALLVILFVLYDVRWPRELAARIKLFSRKAGQVLLILLCCLPAVIPQMLYAFCTTGSLVADAPEGGDGFHFKRPHVLQGLFSFRHGWLIYTPLMSLAIVGFLFLRGGLRMYSRAIPVFFLVYIFAVFSWWCWWYGASFGQRVLIDIYPVLALPLGAFVYKLRRLGGAYKFVLYGTIVVLLAFNLWETAQIHPPPEGEGICVVK